jgi:L-alanine-DL-glutamate epimerase-like enolase superfamily enzyme
MRALSAVDVALWDLLGKVTGQPIYILLGGACRERIPIYNTCGDYGAVRDREAFLSDPRKLARDMLAEGIRMIKIWPFDQYAAATNGEYISPADLAAGLEPVRVIREVAGDDLEIAIEGHCLWNLPAAVRIAHALEPYRPLWLEDMIWPDNLDAVAELRRHTKVPITTSERLFTRFAFREVVERHAADIVMPDLLWAGGFSEGRKIATLASVHKLPVAPHNCGGAVAHLVAAHFCAHVHNLLAMETVRAFYRGFFTELLTNVPIPTRGFLELPPGPGLGTELHPALLARSDLRRETSSHLSEQVLGHSVGDPWTTEKF